MFCNYGSQKITVRRNRNIPQTGRSQSRRNASTSLITPVEQQQTNANVVPVDLPPSYSEVMSNPLYNAQKDLPYVVHLN